MKDLYISELLDPKAQGLHVDLHAAVQQREIKTGARGPYVTMTLADKSGSIDAVWFRTDGSESQIRTDTIILVSGTVGAYNGKAQLSLDNWAHVRDGWDITDYQPTTPHDIEALWNALQEVIQRVSDRDIQTLLYSIIFDPAIESRLKRAPAGMKVHHCFIGGLLDHVVSMCRAAWMLCGHYKRLNRDLLIAGCVLHDLAKVEELTWDLSFGYSKRGSLIGHVPMIFATIERFADRLGTPEQIRTDIEHLVLSHHGTLEHGAAKVPATAEAIALSMIDGLDASLEQFWRLKDATPAGDEFTAYVSSRGTRFYVGAKTETGAEEQAA